MLPKSRFSKPIFGHSAGSTKLDRPYRKQFWLFLCISSTSMDCPHLRTGFGEYQFLILKSSALVDDGRPCSSHIPYLLVHIINIHVDCPQFWWGNIWCEPIDQLQNRKTQKFKKYPATYKKETPQKYLFITARFLYRLCAATRVAQHCVSGRVFIQNWRWDHIEWRGPQCSPKFFMRVVPSPWFSRRRGPTWRIVGRGPKSMVGCVSLCLWVLFFH